MKKSLALFTFAALIAVQASATYIVVLKDGTRYNAKEKWTVVNGKALVKLENGQALTLDPSLIDVPKSEQLTKLGITGAGLIDLDPKMPTAKARPPAKPSLGSQIKLRQKTQEEPAPAAPAPPPTPSESMPALVITRFEKAYDNLGIFEKKLTPNGRSALRAELTVDTEDRVFNAISATSYFMSRNAGVEGVQIEMVELFMKTTSGGSAGRFRMSRADAEALDKTAQASREAALKDYYIRNVIY